VAAMGGGTEADGHFLNDDGHAKSEDYEWKEKADAEFRSRRSVREHAGAVVFAEHDKNSGTDKQPEKMGFGTEAATRAGGEDAKAVVGAVDIFVGDYYRFGFGLGGDGLHSVATCSWPVPRSGRESLPGIG
jgi:hypothetical protein